MYRHLFSTLLATMAVATPTLAQGEQVMWGKGVGISIRLDENGHAGLFAPVKQRERDYIADVPAMFQHALVRIGNRYTIRVENTNFNPVMVCIAVDGRNVISGDRLGDRFSFTQARTWSNDCYVVSAYKSLDVRGFRRSRGSDGKVDRFVVSRAAESAAVQVHNDYTGVGTIVVAVFDEKHAPQWRGGESTERSAAPRSAGPDVGTAAGETVSSPTKSVVFDAQQTAMQAFVVHYGTEQRLRHLGVIPSGSDDDSFKRFGPSSNECGSYFKKKC